MSSPSFSKELDQLRRLLLGSLYFECRSNPTKVTENRLKHQFNKVQCSGCMKDVPFEKFVDVCQLKTAFLPFNVSKNTNKDCLESFYTQNIQDAVVESVVLDEYKNNKQSSSFRPTTPPIQEEQDCVVCKQYLKGTEEPVAVMCGHQAHSTCIKEHMDTQRNLRCPMCSGHMIPSLQPPQRTVSTGRRTPTVLLGGQPLVQPVESIPAKPVRTLKSPESNLTVMLTNLD